MEEDRQLSGLAEELSISLRELEGLRGRERVLIARVREIQSLISEHVHGASFSSNPLSAVEEVSADKVYNAALNFIEKRPFTARDIVIALGMITSPSNINRVGSQLSRLYSSRKISRKDRGMYFINEEAVGQKKLI